jgi:predicted RND superfamily exporter protein
MYVYDDADNSVLSWLPADFPATRDYHEFLAVFGSDESVLVSWPGCTIDDERLERFAAAVEAKMNRRWGRDDADSGDPVWFVDVTTGGRLVERISEISGIEQAAATRRLQGVLVGGDARMTCAVVTLPPLGDRDRREAIDWLRQRAATECQIAEREVRLTGDAVIAAALDASNEQAVNQLILLSMGLALGIAWWCLGSVRVALLVIILAGYGFAIVEALVYYAGTPMNILLALAPVVVFVLAISACIHLCRYFRMAVVEQGIERAPVEMLRAGWKPCVVASLTTALGMVSLAASHVMPVWSFGVFAAGGISLSLVVLLLALPAALPLVDPVAKQLHTSGEQLSDRGWRVATAIIGRRVPILIVLPIVTVGLGIGVTKITSQVRPIRFLPPHSSEVVDFEWFVQHVAPFQSVEVLLAFDEDCPLNSAQRLEAVRQVQQQLDSLDIVAGVMSAATFTSDGNITGLAGSSRVRRLARQKMASRRIDANRDGLIEEDMLADVDAGELWRITARMTDSGTSTMQTALATLDRTVNDALGATDAGEHADVLLTGAVPLLLTAQVELLESVKASFLLAFVTISVVLAVMLGSLRAALLAMLPNVFPAATTLGAMGWLGQPLDVGSMMTISVALGVAVDDTVHYMTWFRRALHLGKPTEEAVVDAYAHCAAPMVQTTLILGCSFSVFVMSDFLPVARFGGLMATILVVALVGDLVLLPALLASRLGRSLARGEPVTTNTKTLARD